MPQERGLVIQVTMSAIVTIDADVRSEDLKRAALENALGNIQLMADGGFIDDIVDSIELVDIVDL